MREPNQEETRPITMLAWQWAKLDKVCLELQQSPDNVLEQFVVWGLHQLPGMERNSAADDLIVEAGGSPPEDEADGDEDVDLGDLLRDVTGS